MNISLRIANYISRYAPSQKKLSEYLEKKNFKWDIPKILWEIGYTEELMLSLWMRSFIARALWERDIKMKLLKKWFPKEEILRIVISFEAEIHEWENYENDILQKIENALTRGKSKQYIAIIFCGKYPYFKDNILEILERSSENEGLKKEIEKYSKKYNLSDRWEQQKFYLALQRKWFSYSAIKDALIREDESPHIS